MRAQRGREAVGTRHDEEHRALGWGEDGQGRGGGVRVAHPSRGSELELIAGPQRAPRAPAQIALAWVVSRPGVASLIVGAIKTRQLGEALAALEITLSDDEVARLEAAYGSRPLGPSAA